MLEFVESRQKNGEAKKSTPLLLQSMSCNSSQWAFTLSRRTAIPVTYMGIAALGANLKTKTGIHLTS